jgi:DNA-binding PadR family transcriptional regulator
MKSVSKELVAAAAIPLILSVLKRNDSYGYAIVQKVKELSEGQISWREASIYPVLKKLEKDGMIKSYWKVTENERPRKYYTILSDGGKQLETNQEEWRNVFSVFKHFWDDSELQGISGK